MVPHFPVTYADLKIYLVHDLENGSSGFKTHLYDHLGVFTHNGCGRGCTVERQSSRLTRPIWTSPNHLIILPVRQKHELLHLLFNNMAGRETNLSIMGY